MNYGYPFNKKEHSAAKLEIIPPQANVLNDASLQHTAPNCPRCGASMVKRTARKGNNSGSDFWGCSNYPTCRGIKNVD